MLLSHSGHLDFKLKALGAYQSFMQARILMNCSSYLSEGEDG